MRLQKSMIRPVRYLKNLLIGYMSKKTYILDSSKDKVLSEILNLFEGKVGMPYSEEQLKEAL